MSETEAAAPDAAPPKQGGWSPKRRAAAEAAKAARAVEQAAEVLLDKPVPAPSRYELTAEEQAVKAALLAQIKPSEDNGVSAGAMRFSHAQFNLSVRFRHEELTSAQPDRHRLTISEHPLGLMLKPIGGGARVLVPWANVRAATLA
jgi:hypothetical protein